MPSGTLPSPTANEQTITINVAGDTASNRRKFTVTLSNPSAGASNHNHGRGLDPQRRRPAANGLLGEYFNTTNLTGGIATTPGRRHGQLPDRLGRSPAGTAVTADDNYSVRWTGFVETSTAGNWTFFTTSNDGVRLFIDDVQIINNWVEHFVRTPPP